MICQSVIRRSVGPRATLLDSVSRSVVARAVSCPHVLVSAQAYWRVFTDIVREPNILAAWSRDLRRTGAPFNRKRRNVS